MRQIFKFLLFLFVCSAATIASAQGVNIDSLRRVIQTAPDDTNKVIAYRMLCGTLSNSDPRAAIPYGWKGAELGKEINWDKGVAGCYLNLSNAYTNLSVYDTALIITDSALIYSKRAGDPNRIALVYINMAATYISQGNLKKALDAALKAIPYAEASGNKDRIGRVYMTLGNITYYQEDWKNALNYYRKCLPLFKELGVKNMIGTSYMNLAVCHKNLGVVDSALYYTQLAIELFREDADNERLMIGYSNLGELYRITKNEGAAEHNFKLAISLATTVGDMEQYAFNIHSLGQLYVEQKKYEEAFEIMLPALDTARKYLFYEEQSYLAKTLSDAYMQNEKYKEAYDYLLEFRIAEDTILTRKQVEELMALQTEYETEQKEKEIKLLNTETALQKNEIKRKNLFNYLLGAGLFSIIVIAVFLSNRSRLKSRLRETELRNKIASDLHDDIGATLSSIKLYSELATDQIRDAKPKTVPLLEKISATSKEMIDSMSDIVWMVKPGNDKFINLEDRMTNFAIGLCSAGNIELLINKDERLDAMVLPMEMKRDIYLAFKEAVNNAVKYSGAALLSIDILTERNNFIMHISDKGKGFDIHTVKKGNGLENIASRMKQHKGEFRVKSAEGEGTTVTLIVPIP